MAPTINRAPVVLEIDVCIAGNPAMNGCCFEPDCVCALADADKFGSMTTAWHPCKEKGCYYRLDEGWLQYAPMFDDGAMDERVSGPVMLCYMDEADANQARGAAIWLMNHGIQPCTHTSDWWKAQTKCSNCGAAYSDEAAERLANS